MKRPCSVCGVMRPVTPSSAAAIVCHVCRRNGHSQRKRPTPTLRRDRPLRQRICKNCGDMFELQRRQRERVHCGVCHTAGVWRLRPPKPPKPKADRMRIDPALRLDRQRRKRREYYRRTRERAGFEVGRTRGRPALDPEEKRRRRRERERALGNDRKRARYWRVEYEPVDRRIVFARDGWRCGICHRRIDRRLRHDHARAVTLDHIVPMSKGGPHTYANTQAAHRDCNTRKRNIGTGTGDQLALIGGIRV